MQRVLALLLLPTLSAAQIDWLEVRQAPSRMVSAPGKGLEDTQEKEYAWGDLDQDGWIDLVVGRKKPFLTSSPKVNVLFMNEGGVLVDRTTMFASASDVPGDEGFKTPTNDRDVLIVDIDGDGWDDVLTATTLSGGYPKHVSHPRAYMNLGNDGSGNWLGLRFEDARIPDFGAAPNFCGMAAGDVTGDDFVDLYFSHYEQGGGVDLEDRLLINDGTGHFTDESSSRMTAQMLNSGFGTSAEILDFNQDGVNDVVKNSGVGLTAAAVARVAVMYNDPTNEGYFNINHTVYNAAPYHVDAGDLNQDGKADLVVGDDAADRYLLSESVDPLGRVIWSPAYTYGSPENTFSTGTQIGDLDDDGWPEVFISDMDPIFEGCNRRLKLYHNRGGVVGGFVDLTEESGNGWTGAVGMTEDDMRGSWDVAIFDIDGDGDSDMIIGRCETTEIWMNQRITEEVGTEYCAPAVPNSTGSPSTIVAIGSTAVIDDDLLLRTTGLPPAQFTLLLASQSTGFVQGAGGSDGDLCLGAPIGRLMASLAPSSAGGEHEHRLDLNALPIPLPPAVLPGDTWNFQSWHRDVGAASNFSSATTVQFD